MLNEAIIYHVRQNAIVFDKYFKLFFRYFKLPFNAESGIILSKSFIRCAKRTVFHRNTVLMVLE